MSSKTVIGIAAFALGMAHLASAQTFTFTVPATSNVFAAGQTSAFSGTLPPYVSFAAGSVESITIEATGEVTLGGGEPYSGPHGIAFYNGTNLSSINGISGLIDTDLGFFLTAVFLDDSAPGGAGPSIFNFTGKEGFTDLHPVVAQSFYMGNGFAGTTAQYFIPPARATRLFLGIADGCDLDSGGPPGCYQDNVGNFLVSVTLHPAAAATK
jgi:hypothetical protein